MRRAGQTALLRFPHTDQTEGKLRPVLLLRKASSRFDDWLVCIVSSQLQQKPEAFSLGAKRPSSRRLIVGFAREEPRMPCARRLAARPPRAHARCSMW